MVSIAIRGGVGALGVLARLLEIFDQVIGELCLERLGELIEAIWVAAEMRPGGAYAHSVLAIEEMEKKTSE